MKALQIVERGKPLAQRPIDQPDTGPGEVLVKVTAAGICRSDVHYRSGTAPTGPLPLTPGHEIAGVIEAVGPQVAERRLGQRVCLHYLVSCGHCHYCALGSEQFCTSGAMLGKHIDGGYAEYIAVPEKNAVPLPDEISFEQGAIIGCSAVTCLHAIRKSRLTAGESVAVFGVGGLGLSAVQLARAFGAFEVYAVDISSSKLKLAAELGAVPVDAGAGDPVAAIMQHTAGRGVDVALELIGLPATLKQAVESLAVFGRAMVVGITDQPMQILPYSDLLMKEAELMGAADHLLTEMPLLLEMVRRGVLQLGDVVAKRLPLEADAVNAELDAIERFASEGRAVIIP
jgi:propanol-preferring alcohol dehydrogenase